MTPARMRELVLRMLYAFGSGAKGSGRRYWRYRRLYDRLTQGS